MVKKLVMSNFARYSLIYDLIFLRNNTSFLDVNKVVEALLRSNRDDIGVLGT